MQRHIFLSLVLTLLACACGRPQEATTLPSPQLSPGQRAVEAQAPLVVANGKMRVRILLESSEGAPTLVSMSYLEGDADVRVPEHTHAGAAEILFIEDGEGVMRIGDREVEVHPGSVIYVPPDTVHDFRSSGTRGLRAIQVYSPPGAEQRFRAAAAPALVSVP